jgi:UDP-N-acetylmuramate dehydrogenase
MTLTPLPNVPLAPLTTIGVGGPAEWFAEARSAEDVAAADRWCRERGAPLTVIGGGSNIVVAEEGVRGLVVRMGVRGTVLEERADQCRAQVGAGESWDALVARLVDGGWAGVECLSGIPGTVGGTPIQNVGAYGQDVASLVDRVQVYDRRTHEVVELPAGDCGFEYRRSRFKGADTGRFVVCRVHLRLGRGAPTTSYPDIDRWLRDHAIDAPSLGDVRRAVLAVRRRKGMVVDASDVDSRSVGSFFTNPVVSDADRRRLEDAAVPVPARPVAGGSWRIPAAWLIERAGWHKGDSDGAVGLSSKHPLAIVNRGGATATAVVRFAAGVKRRVVESLGVWLLPEPVFMGFGGDASIEYLLKVEP